MDVWQIYLKCECDKPKIERSCCCCGCFKFDSNKTLTTIHYGLAQSCLVRSTFDFSHAVIDLLKSKQQAKMMKLRSGDQFFSSLCLALRTRQLHNCNDHLRGQRETWWSDMAKWCHIEKFFLIFQWVIDYRRSNLSTSFQVSIFSHSFLCCFLGLQQKQQTQQILYWWSFDQFKTCIRLQRKPKENPNFVVALTHLTCQTATEHKPTAVVQVLSDPCKQLCFFRYSTVGSFQFSDTWKVVRIFILLASRSPHRGA